MKKIITISLLVIALVLVSTIVSATTTKADLEEFLTSSHKIAGEEVKLSTKDAKQVKDFFESEDGKKLTDEQAANIKSNIDKAIALLNKVGTIDYSKLSQAQKTELLGYAEAAAAEAGLTIDTENRTVLNAAGEVVFKASTNKLVQTGSNNVAYIVAGLAIIAVAGIVIVKRVNA